MLKLKLCKHIEAGVARITKGSFLGEDGKVRFLIIDEGPPKYPDIVCCPWCGHTPEMKRDTKC